MQNSGIVKLAEFITTGVKMTPDGIERQDLSVIRLMETWILKLVMLCMENHHQS